jgi:hypothetical protein
MKHVLSSMVVSVCLSALLGCAGDSSAESPSVESLYVVLNQGIYTDNGIGTKKQTKIISSQADYAMELLNYSSAKPASVDFDKGRVLLVDMGVRNTGGYSVGVASVDVAENWVLANVGLVRPGSGCVVTQAPSNPWQFVFIPSRKEILVSESLKITNC